MKFRKRKKEEPPQEPVKEVTKEAAKEALEEATTVAVLETWPQKRVIIRVILITLMFAAMLWVLYRLQGVILLLVLSIFFSYLVAPLVELVRRPFHLRGRERIIPRPAAIGIVYLVLFGALTIALLILLPKLSAQIRQFATSSGNYGTAALNRVERLQAFCMNNGIPDDACNALKSTLDKAIDSTKTYIETRLPGLVVEVLGYIPWLILIPILSFFFLKDVEAFRRSALQMLPRGRWRWRADEFFQDVNSTLAAYIRAQLTACLLIGTECTVGFIILGVPFPLVLGVIAGLFEFIPLVGPLVVAIIAALVTSFSPDTSTYSALWVLMFLAVLRIVHDYTVYPRLVSQGVHLHPLAVILAILCGAELAGIAGIFLSIPVIAIATVSYRHWLEHRGSEGLVAEILQPAEGTDVVVETESAEQMAALIDELEHHASHSHPSAETTPDEMARRRPDLTTGELRMPKVD